MWRFRLCSNRFIRVGKVSTVQVKQKLQDLDTGKQVVQNLESRKLLVLEYEQNNALKNYLSRVIGHTAGGIALSAATSASFVTGLLPIPSLGLTLGFGIIGSLICLVGATTIKPLHYLNGNGHLVTSNSILRTLLVYAFYSLQGVLLAPLISASSPSVVLAATLVTGGVVAGMGAFAISKPSGSLSMWSGPLYVGLIGLLCCGIGSIIFGGALGSSLFWVSCIGGVAVFAAFTAYDIHRAVQDYQQGYADHLGHSLNLLLNIINIFKNILLVLRAIVDE